MPTRNDQREQDDKARLERLRAAAREGFDAAARGDYVTLNSEEELDAFLDEIHEEVSAGSGSPSFCRLSR